MGITTASMACKIGGDDYDVSPLSLKQIEELDNWMQVRFLRVVKEAADGDLATLMIGMREMLKLSFFTRAGAHYLKSVEGVAKLFSLSTGVEYEKAREICHPDVDISEFSQAFSKVNGLEKKEGESEEQSGE